MPGRKLKVYLAGPISNCNEKQRTEWRKRLKQVLMGKGFDCLDPTDRNSRKGVVALTEDVEDVDVVIANLWKESIGTVMGIVHARRLGIPVILVDPNFISNSVIESLVDRTVRDCESAANILEREIAPALKQQLLVYKRDGTQVPFSQRKLQNSVRAACASASVDDTTIPMLLSRRVYRAIKNLSSKESITTGQIRATVFEELQKLSKDDPLFSDPETKLRLQKQAEQLKYAWELHEIEKHDEDPHRQLKNARKEIDVLKLKLMEAEQENNVLRANLNVLRSVGTSKTSTDVTNGPSDFAVVLERELGGKKCLCVCRKGCTSFESTFQRMGVSQKEFARFFVEQQLDGKQSNLNAEMVENLEKYPYVLYAAASLRHLHREVKTKPNLIWGAGPNDVIRRFMHRFGPA